MQISTTAHNHTYASGSRGLGLGFWAWTAKKSAVGVPFFNFLLFVPGNSAKVNRMSTAHMQGEHLIKNTHPHSHGDVLSVRNTCDTWPRPSVKFTRQCSFAGFSRRRTLVLQFLYLYLCLYLCLYLYLWLYLKLKSSLKPNLKMYLNLKLNLDLNRNLKMNTPSHTYTLVDQIRLGHTDDWFCNLAKNFALAAMLGTSHPHPPSADIGSHIYPYIHI